MHVLWPPSAVLADVLDSEFCRGKLWAKIEFAFWGVCMPSLGARSQERAPSGAAALGSGRPRERTPSGADALGGGRCKIKENRKKFSSRYARQQLKIVKKMRFALRAKRIMLVTALGVFLAILGVARWLPPRARKRAQTTLKIFASLYARRWL